MPEIGSAGNRSLTTYDCLELDFIFSSSVRRRYIWHIYIGSVIIVCSDNRYIVCPITKKQRSVTHKTKGATVRHLTTTKHKICKSYIYITSIYMMCVIRIVFIFDQVTMMGEDLRKAFKKIIQDADWMDAATRRTAEEKVRNKFCSSSYIYRNPGYVLSWCNLTRAPVSAEITCSVTCMMTSSNGSIFRVTGHLCGEFTSHHWIPRTKASDAELWCFLWSAPE